MHRTSENSFLMCGRHRYEKENAGISEAMAVLVVTVRDERENTEDET